MFEFFRRFSEKQIRDRAESEAKQLVDQLRHLKTDGDPNSLKSFLSDALIPKDAVSLNGHFSSEIELAIKPFLERAKEPTEQEFRDFEDKLLSLYAMMRNFYRSLDMPTWIFHQVCVKLNMSDEFEQFFAGKQLSKLRDTDSKSWILLGYKQFVIEWVETKYGPMSCTKERFWESSESEAVERLYEAFLAKMGKSEAKAFASNLMCMNIEEYRQPSKDIGRDFRVDY